MPGDAQAITRMDAKEGMASLLVFEIDISAFKGLTPRPLKPMGAPSLYFLPP